MSKHETTDPDAATGCADDALPGSVHQWRDAADALADKIGSTSTTGPRRIQRSRAKGWRMPEGAIYVGRPTIYGNAHKIGDTYQGRVLTAQDVVDLFRATFPPAMARAAKHILGGRDLACWCPLDQPCHADVLLEMANG